ncbi:uncharacterized protein LOC114730843 [Neltuma alba]|uniref:uncharacterized protein LOC114730843 n=1 Tax=Neltuma alba TaxID=207710 RepID=UPI0010A4D6D9|nr:uncharacterized protein LOC114730843 [Prosopis alba]
MRRSSRGDGGEWLKGFLAQLACCEVIEAEAWGILVGPELCRDMAFMKIEVECDSKQVVGLINHVSREGNQAADKLAHLSLQQDSSRTIWDMPPPEIWRILDEDLAGTEIPRRVYTVCNGHVM